MTAQRRTNRTLIWFIVLVVFVVLLALASIFTGGQRISGVATIGVTAIGLILVFGIYLATAENDAWAVGTREVVYMAIGAALYGVFNWIFNTIPMPSVSQVALRPSVCIPIFFGFVFGPVVGFFTGAVGNILGDFLTGWGVLVIALIIITVALIFINPEVVGPWTGEIENFRLWAWIFIVGGAVVIAGRFILERFSVDLAAVNLWGTLGIIVGIGFASIADIWINGYSLATAIIGEFAPAAGPNILNAMILTPILLAAYEAVQARTGR